MSRLRAEVKIEKCKNYAHQICQPAPAHTHQDDVTHDLGDVGDHGERRAEQFARNVEHHTVRVELGHVVILRLEQTDKYGFIYHVTAGPCGCGSIMSQQEVNTPPPLDYLITEKTLLVSKLQFDKTNLGKI